MGDCCVLSCCVLCGEVLCADMLCVCVCEHPRPTEHPRPVLCVCEHPRPTERCQQLGAVAHTLPPQLLNPRGSATAITTRLSKGRRRGFSSPSPNPCPCPGCGIQGGWLGCCWLLPLLPAELSHGLAEVPGV